MSEQCDPEIFKNGSYVTMVAGSTAKDTEAMVQKVAKSSGQLRTDWSYVGGRAVIQTLDDVEILKSHFRIELKDRFEFQLHEDLEADRDEAAYRKYCSDRR